MGIFGSNKEKSELVLVFDIGSSSVGGALFWVQQSGIPKIIYCIRESIELEEKVDTDRFLFLTIKSLEIVTSKIFKAGLGAPSRIFCVLSSPWYVSQTRIIKFKKNEPFIFTSKFADELIQKEVSLFEEEFFAKYMHAGSPIRSIELQNIKIMLNGYETATPLNQRANELEMNIFISMSIGEVLNRIEDTVNKHFSFKNIKFSSFAMASFSAVRDIYTHQEHFLLLDVAGEMTDISIVKKNVLWESISFPIGRNFMIREVSNALNCSLNEARAYISLFNDGHAENTLKKKIGPIINQLKGEWLQKFQESLSHLSNDISIPATVYLAVDKDLSDFFLQTIKTEQFSQYTLTESKFQVIFLGSELLHDFASFTENALRDPFLTIDSIYINRFLIKPTH